MSPITIEVPDEAARAFEAAPPEKRRKLELLMALRLEELLAEPIPSLTEIMDRMSAEAEARGMTDEILESILHER
jgi:hypothetical protein